MILKYKPPFKNLMMIPNPQKLSFANIPPSTFAYNTKLQLSGAIFTRIFENREIRDFRLEKKNKSTEIKQWESDFQTYNQNILYNKNYSQFETIEEFSIYRKKNGKKILSLLLKDLQDQSYLTKTINEIEKTNEVVIQYINIQNKDSYYYLFLLSILLL
jgi:glutaredoxin 2